jgi:putative FmdB family regulatory protein
MPLYEYQCPGCGKRIEVLQKLGEDGSGLTCPECGVTGLRKLMSASAVQVSGGSGSAPGPGCGAGGCPAAGSGFS